MKWCTKLFFLFILLPFSALANIRLDKYLIVLEGNQRNESLYISNSEKDVLESKRYSVDFVNYKQMSDGSYKEIKLEDENNKFADRFLIISPRRFTLEPGGSQLVKIYRKPFDSSVQDGEYRSHLRIQEIPQEKPAKNDVSLKRKQFGFDIVGIFGMTIPVILKKGMDTHVVTDIEDLQYFIKDGKSYLKITVARSGHSSAIGKIVVDDEKGKEIARFERFNIFTSTNSRQITAELDQKIMKSKKKIVVKYIDNKDVILSKKILDI